MNPLFEFRSVQPDSSVQFGLGCQTFWVHSVQFGMALERDLSSVPFPSLLHTNNSHPSPTGVLDNTSAAAVAAAASDSR